METTKRGYRLASIFFGASCNMTYLPHECQIPWCKQGIVLSLFTSHYV